MDMTPWRAWPPDGHDPLMGMAPWWAWQMQVRYANLGHFVSEMVQDRAIVTVVYQ